MNLKQFIPKTSKGSPFAIADIHGCSKTFRNLVENKIQLNKNDQLFLLGDYINRGPDSKGVLDFILELKEQNFQVFSLRGNHEQKFLMAYECGKQFLESFLMEYRSKDLLSGNIQDYVQFCLDTQYYYFSGEFFLSHCGVEKNNKTALTDIRLMFNNADIILDEELLEKSYHIHGHKSNHIYKIQKAIENQEKSINLDAGCVYKNVEGLGFLVALNLDTWELIIQKNID